MTTTQQTTTEGIAGSIHKAGCEARNKMNTLLNLPLVDCDLSQSDIGQTLQAGREVGEKVDKVIDQGKFMAELLLNPGKTLMLIGAIGLSIGFILMLPFFAANSD